MDKLILEAFEDEELNKEDIIEPDLVIDADKLDLDNQGLTEQEKDLFHSSLISDLLKQELDLFNLIKSYLNDPNDEIDEPVRLTLESVSEDVALSIGKLEQCLKEAVDEKTEELINQGEEDLEPKEEVEE